MAATTTFTAALLIFINIWLVALAAFGVVASSVFLYVLDTVDVSIGPSLGISTICAVISFLYLTVQCVNVSHTQQGRWHRSWLSSICIQLPRALIVLWMIATIVGFVSAVRKPLCLTSGAGQDTTALQADIGCWIFRVLVFLDAIMLVLCFVLFCLLEVNGRYVSLALFHFEYTRSSSSPRYRRRNLIASPHGASVETLAYPIHATLEHGPECKYEKHSFQSKKSLSPSPTYHTFDSTKTNTPLWPGSGSSSGALSRHGSRDDLLYEFPIPIDLTLHGSLPARRSAAFTADISFPHAVDANANTIFSGAQLQSRPISNLPALPSTAQGTSLDLKAAPNPIVTGPMAAKAILDRDTSIRPARHNLEVNMVEPRSRFKSSSALPFEYTTRAHSMVDLSSCLTTELATDAEAVDDIMQVQPHRYNPSIDTTHRLSTSRLPEHPPPAWCPQSLKIAPLSADPAIRRLAEFHPRSRNSAMRASRISNMGRRRGSLGAFEFGFHEDDPSTSISKSLAPTSSQNTNGENIDLSALPPTPTPLTRKSTASINVKREARKSVSTHNKDKSVQTPTGNTEMVNSNASTAPATIPSESTTPSTAPKKPADQIMSRGRARNTSTSTSSIGQFSIMPPLTTHKRRKTSNCTTISTSGLGLTFDGATTSAAGKAMGSKKQRAGHGHSRSGSTAMTAVSGKKIVERGRWEKLPR